MTRSETLFQRAQQSIPGGVNSPVRAFKSVGGYPRFIQSAKGALLTDADGNDYIDFINSWGPMIMGHAYAPVTEAIKERLEHSTSFGAPTELEIDMAELIKSMAPNVDLIRMVNSGTEACMSAVRLAKGYTGRSKIIKFAGCYHGHADCFLIQAGSGALTLGEPNSPGVTQGVAADTLTAQFNDIESVKALVEACPDQIAALILEPVAGNMGCIPPKAGFLEALRTLCTEHGIVLIFDEVMTGFRLAAGGAQEYYKVDADLVTYGKIIGGGMPVGAFGGKAEIMAHLAPTGPVYQAGTLSGNPIAMIAGYTLLNELKTQPQLYEQLEATTKQLHENLHEAANDSGIPCQINRVGSMISVHFSEKPVTDFNSATQCNMDRFNQLFHTMLNNGIYLPPSAYETWFISTAITELHMDKTITTFRNVLRNF
jgi:glutamate-1-semialdehyde 2,1-aminomutase